MATANKGDRIILYDGVCPLCNASVKFLLDRDTDGLFLFAPLQSDLAADILDRHDQSETTLDSIAYVQNYGTADERLYRKSDGVLMACYELGGIWAVLSYSWYIPRLIRDAVYDFIAAIRYRVFGKYEECRIPDPDQRERFLD